MITASGWRAFEQLIAAIQRAEHHGAVVTWDEEISDRQFDVTVRFDAGGYHYLVVVECRDQPSQAVKALDVDAFVTKSHDVHANKAIMVSTSGFQDGAITVARRHGIDLVTISEAAPASPSGVQDRTVPALFIRNVRLEVVDGPPIVLSEEPTRLHFQIRNTLLQGTGESMTVERVIDVLTHDDRIPPVKQTNFSKEWVFPEPVLATGRALENEAKVKRVSFDCEVQEARVMGKDNRLDPNVFARMMITYRHQNVVTGADWTFEGALRFDTVLQPGHFYTQPPNGFGYYCHAIEGDQAVIFLVESYQHGSLFQAKLRQAVDESFHYLEVTDKDWIARLRKLLTPMLAD